MICDSADRGPFHCLWRGRGPACVSSAAGRRHRPCSGSAEGSR
ncbi:hypothetical protein [Streptomyces platensis]